MFILGKEKQLSAEDSTRQILLLRLLLRKKKASTLFEIFLALLIKYVDDNDDNNTGDYHISPESHHHLQGKFVLVVTIRFVSIMIILCDRNCTKHSYLAYIASFDNGLIALIGICHVKRE